MRFVVGRRLPELNVLMRCSLRLLRALARRHFPGFANIFNAAVLRCGQAAAPYPVLGGPDTAMQREEHSNCWTVVSAQAPRVRCSQENRPGHGGGVSARPWRVARCPPSAGGYSYALREQVAWLAARSGSGISQRRSLA
jgi:hypothetical protein